MRILTVVLCVAFLVLAGAAMWSLVTTVRP
jgi:hypothetical protein